MKKPQSKKVLKWVAWTSLALVVLLAVFTLSIPFLVTHIPIPSLEYDLSPYLDGKAAELVKSRKVTANVKIRRGLPDGFRVRASGMLLDWPYTATATLRFGFVKVDGSFAVALDDTDWKLTGSFAASSSTDWSFDADIKERKVTQDDPVLSALLQRLKLEAASNLVFSGTFALRTEGQISETRPVPSWKAVATVKGADVSLDTAPGQSLDVRNLSLKLGATGIANHVDIMPMFPHADSATAAGIALTNVYASIRATERAYLVTEAGAGCCGGELRLYSLFLDPARLSTGATIFVDGADAGQVLSLIAGIDGTATGSLHGKLSFFLKNGMDLHVKSAYLFSKPGEIGKMRISDSAPILDNLAMGGVSRSDRDNLAKALANLDYSVLKIELVRGGEGEESSLPIMIEGTTTDGKTTVPVNLNITFHGDFDKLINTGMKLTRRMQ